MVGTYDLEVYASEKIFFTQLPEAFTRTIAGVLLLMIDTDGDYDDGDDDDDGGGGDDDDNHDDDTDGGDDDDDDDDYHYYSYKVYFIDVWLD